MKKVVIFYPYNTGDKAFSGGVAKVIVSNIIAVHQNGDQPYLVLPIGNIGLIRYVNEHYPYCIVKGLDFSTFLLYSDVKNQFKRVRLIVKNLIKYYTGRDKIRKYFEEIQPNIIHYHETINYPLLGIYTKCKIVLHVHSYRIFCGDGIYNIIVKRLANATNKYANAIISPTNSITDAFQPYLKKKIRLIKTPYLDMSENNINLSHNTQLESYKKDDKIIFAFIGRICPIKRLDYFIRALAMLPNELKQNIKYTIIGGCNNIGDEDYKSELIKLAKNNGLENVVSFVGYVSPIESALQDIDWGVMLTESEAMPMVGIEYMKYNIPIIGYDVPGINDFLVNGVNGYLIENGKEKPLTEAVAKVIKGNSLPDFKYSISEVFKGYSVEEFAEKIKEIYK